MNQNSVFGVRSLLACLVIAALGGAIYSNTLSSPFVFDDVRNITNNPSAHWDSISLENVRQTIFEPTHAVSKRRPLALVTFGANHALGGRNDVTGYHVVNIAIHVVNGGLVFFLAYLLLARLGVASVGNDSAEAAGEQRSTSLQAVDPFVPALVAACFFVAHPIQTQAVTYLVQRMTSLAVLFYLSALLLYVGGCLTQGIVRRWACWIGCLLAWILAMGTKEIAVTLPVAILLIEWFFFRGRDNRWRWRACAWIAVTVFLAVGLYVAGWYLSTNTTFMSFKNRDFSMVERLLTQPRVVMFYISLLVAPLPSRLNLLHDMPISQSLLDPPSTILAMLAIVALLVVAVRLARRAPLLSFGILWFFLHLALESSVLPLELVYEHRVYLPLFGISLMVAYLAQYLLARNRVGAIALLVVIIAGLSAATYARNRDWRDRVVLWSDVIAKNPLSDRAYSNRGLIYEELGELEAALADYTQAIELKPEQAKAFSNRGNVYQRLEKHKQALSDYAEAIRLQADLAEAYYNRGTLYTKLRQLPLAIKDFGTMIELKPNNASAYNGRGDAYRMTRKPQLAIADYTKAIELSPQMALGYLNRGNAYRALGKSQLAIRDYNSAIEVAANPSEAFNNRGTVYMAIGNWQAAAGDFATAIAGNPDDSGAHNNLAWLLATSPDARTRDGRRALKHGLRAQELLGANNVSALDTLAAAFAEAGQFDDAVRTQTKAVGLVPPQASAELRERLELYKTHKPFRMGGKK